MKVTLCDACRTEVKNTVNTFRLSACGVRYRIKIELTANKFYRVMELCEPCADRLKEILALTMLAIQEVNEADAESLELPEIDNSLDSVSPSPNAPNFFNV